jgi:DNA-binding LytR/AlgR family response regulator
MSLKDEIPSYLRSKYQLIGTVTFTAFFSLVFMLVSIPFSHNAWFELGGSLAFAFTAAFFLIGLVVIIISKRVMYATRSMKLTLLQYVLWNLTEMVVICLLYVIFSQLGDRFGIIRLHEGERIGEIFLNSLVYAFMSLIIPEIIAGMYFAIIDKNNTIRLMNYRNIVSDEPVAPAEEKKITLFDNSGVMKLSVSLSNLYFIESDDNYIIVWYTDSEGELKKYMLRCRLKTVEESFSGSSLARCHRKYIVNLDKVKVLRKEKDGYVIVLENDAIKPIPVSKTYSDSILGHFNPAVENLS